MVDDSPQHHQSSPYLHCGCMDQGTVAIAIIALKPTSLFYVLSP